MADTPHQAFIGLMSGTSLDGVDGVLAFIGRQGQWLGVQAHAHLPFDDGLRAELLALNTAGADELHRAALAGQGVSRAYAEVVRQLMLACPGTRPAAAGAHGQTVRHRPELGYTLQILAPALLAELAGVDVVADFRSRDVAAGGQGAPLVPIFHQAVFAPTSGTRAVLNVGGMANLTVLAGPSGTPQGFDCGPGNVLMDAWCQRQLGQPFDAGGQWAAQGQVRADWLAQALAEPFFSAPPPKSTGRDLFNEAWLDAWLARCTGGDGRRANAAGDEGQRSLAADVQATLCALTAQGCADALLAAAPDAAELVVCGGGALNGALMAALAQRLPGISVTSSDVHGLPAMQVEASAFAWLAWATLARRTGNVPAVTGANGPRVLGAIYPA